MFIEAFVIVVAPQRGPDIAIDIPDEAGTLLVTVTIRWSPGFSWRVGFSRPPGVMKQKSVRPSASIRVWYEKLTLRTPLSLNRLGGLRTTLPAAGRGQGLATGATEFCAKAETCAEAKMAVPITILRCAC